MTAAPQIALPGIEAKLGDDGSDSCFTPPDIIAGAEAALGGIHTDPCWHPSSSVPDGPVRYDGRERGDGLARPWEGSLWMNPPYSAPEPWALRWAEHASTDAPCLALMKLDPTTEWWRIMTSHRRALVGLCSSRVAFLGDYAKGNTPNMCVVFISMGIGLRRLRKSLPMAQWWER